MQVHLRRDDSYSAGCAMRSQGPTRTWHPTGVLVISLISVVVISIVRSFSLVWFEASSPPSAHAASVPSTQALHATAKLADPGKLIFLKTHKTGSSTLSGVLWRELCERRGLHCFLPPERNPGRTWNFDKARDREYAMHNAGTGGKGVPYDVWLHHARRTDSLFSEVMNFTHSTAPGIRYISIVRSPDHRFRSAWTWYKHNRTFGGISLERFADLMCLGADCDVLITSSASSWLDFLAAPLVQMVAGNLLKYRTGLDSTAEELVGLRAGDAAFPARFTALLDDVAAGRVLLLVCDRFEESLLVLDAVLRNSMPIGTEDASANAQQPLPYPQLAHLRQKQQGALEAMSERTAARLLQLQPYDTALFHAASTMLDHYIANLYDSDNGTHFATELQTLRRQSETLRQACAENSTTSTPALAAECALLRRDNKDLVQAAWRITNSNA